MNYKKFYKQLISKIFVILIILACFATCVNFSRISAVSVGVISFEFQNQQEYYSAESKTERPYPIFLCQTNCKNTVKASDERMDSYEYRNIYLHCIADNQRN